MIVRTIGIQKRSQLFLKFCVINGLSMPARAESAGGTGFAFLTARRLLKAAGVDGGMQIAAKAREHMTSPRAFACHYGIR
jgi:hypothetical protein